MNEGLPKNVSEEEIKDPEELEEMEGTRKEQLKNLEELIKKLEDSDKSTE